jgi:acyl-CoA thioesterase FadM
MRPLAKPPEQPCAAVYRVRFEEAGPDGLVRASVLLQLAHDVAWRHAAELGFDRAWYEARRLGWLVRSVDLEIRRPIAVGADLSVSTELVTRGGSWARRRAVMGAVAASGDPATTPNPTPVGDPAGDAPAAVALTDWVLIDGRGRPTRLPSEVTDLFGSSGGRAELGRVPIGEPPAAAVHWPLEVQLRDLDPNGHVNNAVIVDWIDQAVSQAGPARVGSVAAEARLPRCYRVEYLAPIPPGQTLDLVAWPDHDRVSIRIASRREGREVARAQLLPGSGSGLGYGRRV